MDSGDEVLGPIVKSLSRYNSPLLYANWLVSMHRVNLSQPENSMAKERNSIVELFLVNLNVVCICASFCNT